MAVDPLTALLNVGESVINRIWPDASERGDQILKLKEIASRGDIAELEANVKLLTAQMQVNAKEAEHSSLFVAGWRPFCGWVGGVAFSYAAIIEPIMRFSSKLLGYNGDYPQLDTTITVQILIGMLGLGLMRSHDKIKKVDTKNIGDNK